MTGQTHGFLGYAYIDALHFKQDRPRANFGHKELWAPFAASHFHVLWLTSHRSVWEDANPDLTAALDVPRERDTSGLDLPVGDVRVLQRLDAVFAEGEAHEPAGGEHGMMEKRQHDTATEKLWRIAGRIDKPWPRQWGTGKDRASYRTAPSP